MLECAFVGLDHCGSIFRALTSSLVPLDPFCHSWGFIPTALYFSCLLSFLGCS